MLLERTKGTKYGSLSSQIHYLPLHNYFIKYPPPLSKYVMIYDDIVNPLPPLAVKAPTLLKGEFSSGELTVCVFGGGW